MIKHIVLAAAAAFLFAGPAQAESWYRIAVTDTAGTYIDADSITRRGDEATAIMSRIWITPIETGMVSSLTRYGIRCSDRSYIALNRTSFRGDGSSDSWIPAQTREFATDQTVIHSVILFVCGDRSLRTRVASPEADARPPGGGK